MTQDNETVRVAAVQFAAGDDVDENLETALRMIDEAASCSPDLVVLPEFSNHLSWYDSKEHCWDVSVDLEGRWIGAIADKARGHSCYIVVNATVRRGPGRATGTSVLLSPDGEILGTSDKQVLMGHENDYLERATEVAPIVDTAVGRVSMYACMDGVINETPRCLALRGAEILANSLNSFALDEASLHVRVRAPENRVFVVAANKVGPLIPEALLRPVSEATSIPKEHLYGAGESQVVAPDGTVLAKAPREGEAFVYADIDPHEADAKLRPDGTDVFETRRPDLYAALADEPHDRPYESGAQEVTVAVYQPSTEGAGAIEECASAVADAAAAGASLMVLPELAFGTDPSITQVALDSLGAACRHAGDIRVVASVAQASFEGDRHVGMLIGPHKIEVRQPQLTRVARHPWATGDLGVQVEVTQLPWARLAIVVGDDALHPEVFRLAALQNAEVVAVPYAALETWETETGLRERSAENRVCLVAATRPSDAGTSQIMTLHTDFTLMTPWENRVFDGNISSPIVTDAAAAPGLTIAPVNPANARNKLVSANTDVVDGRPWYLLDAITETPS